MIDIERIELQENICIDIGNLYKSLKVFHNLKYKSVIYFNIVEYATL